MKPIVLAMMLLASTSISAQSQTWVDELKENQAVREEWKGCVTFRAKEYAVFLTDSATEIIQGAFGGCQHILYKYAGAYASIEAKVKTQRGETVDPLKTTLQVVEDEQKSFFNQAIDAVLGIRLELAKKRKQEQK